MNNILNIFVILIFFNQNIYSQNNEVGLFFGGTNYIGEVGPTTYVNPFIGEYSRKNILKNIGDKTINYALGFMYRKNLDDRIAIRLQYNYANIGSNDNWYGSSDARKARAKRFENRLNELHLGLDFNFEEFDVESFNFQKTTYINAGINYFRFNALHYPNKVDVAQQFGKANSFSIPVTIGYKIKPNKEFLIGFEISAKYSLTDNLDGSNTDYIDREKHSQPNFGNDLSNDWYVFTGFTLTYLFGNYDCDCTR